MLKRKFFAVALPIIAGATIVGAGFSAWVFSNPTPAGTQGVGVEISQELNLEGAKIKTYYTQAGKTATALAAGDNVKLVLDQGHLTSATTAEEKGIYFVVTNNSGTRTVIDNLQFVVEDTGTTIEDLAKAGYNVELETTVTFNTTLLNYVSEKANTTWADDTFVKAPGATNVYTSAQKLNTTKEIGNNEYTLDAGKKLTINVGSVSEGPVGEFYNTNKMFKWAQKDGTKLGKPTDTSSLKAMTQAIGTLNDAVKFDFKLNIKNAA